MDNLFRVEKIYTVLELNNAVRGIIKSEFSEYIWVCGEIQDFRASRDKRHIYFTFVQKHPKQDAIMAKVSAAIFESRKPRVFSRLKEAEEGFELKDDIEVKFLCEVDLYPKTGNFSLIIVDVDPMYTLGKIAQSRQKIIEDLRKKGLLDKNKSCFIPSVPLKIGLITSQDSAAYHDFTNEIEMSGYGFEILLCNCHMQGNLVEEDVIWALNFLNNLSPEELDVIIITRGGGSTADLSYFDNKKIAERVALSRFPVISAIGHQINTTIADVVAHTFCKTPTKSAQLLIERVKVFVDNLDSLQERISERAEEFMGNKRKDLRDLTLKIELTASRYFRFHSEDILNKTHNILSVLKISLAEDKESLKRYFEGIRSALNKVFKHSRDNLNYVEDKIKILDPKNTLKRGYSITFKGRRAVKSVDDVSENDILRTILYKGSIFSKVKKKEISDE